jgi:hypothetical protein
MRKASLVGQIRYRSLLRSGNFDAIKDRLYGVLITKLLQRYCCTAAKKVRIG